MFMVYLVEHLEIPCTTQLTGDRSLLGVFLVAFGAWAVGAGRMGTTITFHIVVVDHIHAEPGDVRASLGAPDGEGMLGGAPETGHTSTERSHDGLDSFGELACGHCQ